MGLLGVAVITIPKYETFKGYFPDQQGNWQEHNLEKLKPQEFALLLCLQENPDIPRKELAIALGYSISMTEFWIGSVFSKWLYQVYPWLKGRTRSPQRVEKTLEIFEVYLASIEY